MFIKKEKLEEITFTHEEIDIISECIKHTQEYYLGWMMLYNDWNPERHKEQLKATKEKLRILEELQRRTTYIGQSDIYK